MDTHTKTQTPSKKNRPAIIAAALGAALCLIVVPLLTPQADASLSNGGFCIRASYDSDPEIEGKAGAKNCGEAPTTPSVPTPDLAVAGVCALPNASRTVFALNGTTRSIEGYEVGADGSISANGWSLPIQGTGALNSLGVSPLGSFYLTIGNRPARVNADGSVTQLSAQQVSGVAGEAMVYKGAEEFYYGGFTGGRLTVFRSSPAAQRSGFVFSLTIPNAAGGNGDFSFDRSGALRVLVSSGGPEPVAGIYTLPFSAFADLDAGTSPQLDALSEGVSITAPGPLNGVVYLSDGTTLASWSKTSPPASGAIVAFASNGTTKASHAVTGITDLASCRVSG